MKINYCMQCGELLVERAVGDEGKQKYCPRCQKFYFDNPAVVILVAVLNEAEQVLLLRQNYVSKSKWVLCSGYVQKRETLEQAAAREVLEETGQTVHTCDYIRSYWFAPKSLVMAGFLARVKAREFNHSNEVDSLMWCDLDKALPLAAYENNFSKTHLENCIAYLKR